MSDVVGYVYNVYNVLSYSELSIYVCFKLLLDTPHYVYLLLLHFDLQQMRHVIMSYY